MKFYDKNRNEHKSLFKRNVANAGITVKRAINKIRHKTESTADTVVDDFFDDDDFELWDDDVADGEEAPEAKKYSCTCGNLKSDKPGEKCDICGTETA